MIPFTLHIKFIRFTIWICFFCCFQNGSKGPIANFKDFLGFSDAQDAWQKKSSKKYSPQMFFEKCWWIYHGSTIPQKVTKKTNPSFYSFLIFWGAVIHHLHHLRTSSLRKSTLDFQFLRGHRYHRCQWLRSIDTPSCTHGNDWKFGNLTQRWRCLTSWAAKRQVNSKPTSVLKLR